MEEPRRADRPKAGHWAALVAAITALGAIPRILAFRESLAWDELYLYAWVHDRGLGDMLHSVASIEKTPPLGFLLAWGFDQVGGPPQLIRLPELLAGLALIPLVAILGRIAFDRRVGVVAASLTAASPFLVFYSVEARSYGLTTTLCVAVAICLLMAMRGSDNRRWWIGYSLLSAAALMSHYIAAGFLAAAASWALVAHRERWRAVLAAQAGPALAVLIWLPGLTEQVGNSSDELRRLAIDNPLSLDTVTDIIARTSIGHPLVGLDRVPGTVGMVLVAFGFGIAVAAGLISLTSWVRSPKRRMPNSEAALVGVLAAAAPLLAILVSAQPDQSILIPRNLIVSLPPLLVLVAVLLSRPPKVAAWAASLLVIAGLTVGTIAEVTREQRPAARAAALATASRWEPGDRIIELLLIGAKGPLGKDVAINLPGAERGALAVLGSTGPKAYSETLSDRGRVFLIGYSLRGSKEPLFFDPPAEWSRRYTPVWTKRWPGIVDTVVTEYEPNGGKPTG